MPNPDPPPIARQQDAVFTVRQARSAGVSARQLRRLTADATWVRIVGDVLVPAGTAVTASRSLRAAMLATGGVLSHVGAADLWRLPVPVGVRSSPHVTVPVECHPRVAGVQVHRRPLGSHETVHRDGLTYTSHLRTTTDCLTSWPRTFAADLLDDLLRRGSVTLDQLDRACRGLKFVHGRPQLGELLEEASAGSWSAAERRLHQLLRADGITGWIANQRLALPGGATVVVDVWFPGHQVVVEVDGQAWHVSPERFQRDRSRQNALVLAGYTVLRFTWTDLTNDPASVIVSIKAALQRHLRAGKA